MDIQMQASRSGSLIHSGRIVASCALGGAVFASLGLGWVPALAAVDLHAVGAIVGGTFGVVARICHVI